MSACLRQQSMRVEAMFGCLLQLGVYELLLGCEFPITVTDGR